MKLIVSNLEALRRYVSREFYYIQADLIRNYGWAHIETHRLWNAPTIAGTITDTLGQLPDVILFWEGYDLISTRAAEIARLDCRRFIMADDLHCWNEDMQRRKSTAFQLCDTVLSTYGYAWDRFYPELPGKTVVWIPHSASQDFLIRFNPDPENAILLSGAVTLHYPLRQQMKILHDQRRYAIAHHAHPGYHCGYDYETNDAIGRGYARRLFKHRAGFTDALKYEYVVAKYFEIPATGALLLADAAVREPLRTLGFMEDEHYVPVSMENLEEKVRYVLDQANHEQLDEVRRRAQELVRQRHKTSDRAREMDAACTG